VVKGDRKRPYLGEGSNDGTGVGLALGSLEGSGDGELLGN